MANPALADAVGKMTTGITRYLVTIGIDEVSGRMTKETLPDGRSVMAVDTAELAPFPSLDEARVGESLGDAVGYEAEAAPPPIPEETFAGVVGLEYERAVLRHCLGGEWTPRKHALITGPPGSAKSFLLERVIALPNARYITEYTRAGLRRIVGEEMGGSGILAIDEIEKADRDAQDALLTIMDGHLAPALHGQTEATVVTVRVIGAANYPERLTDPLRSRFNVLALPDYGIEQRKAVMASVLEQREGISPEMAQRIAGLVAPHSADVRAAERIAEAELTDPKLAAQMAERLGKAPAPAPRP